MSSPNGFLVVIAKLPPPIGPVPSINLVNAATSYKSEVSPAPSILNNNLSGVITCKLCPNCLIKSAEVTDILLTPGNGYILPVLVFPIVPKLATTVPKTFLVSLIKSGASLDIAKTLYLLSTLIASFDPAAFLSIIVSSSCILFLSADGKDIQMLPSSALYQRSIAIV